MSIFNRRKMFEIVVTKNNNKNLFLLLLSVTITIALTTSVTFATINSGSVDSGSSDTAGGIFELVTPPVPGPNGGCAPNSVGDNCQDTHDLWAFDEDQNIILAAPLSVNDIDGDGVDDAAVLPMGTSIASHYVYYDPADNNPLDDIQGCVQFDSHVLATIFDTTELAASDFLANVGVNYLNPALRGFEAGDVATFNANEVCVDLTASTPGDYFRVLTEFSPGAEVFTVSKTWTHTDYNWDPVCDGFVNATGFCVISDVDNTEIGFRPANINNNFEPDDDVLADPLPFDDTIDKFTAFAQVHKNKFKNTNPGAFYALTTAVIPTSLSSIEVWEDYEDCTNDGEGILKFVSKKLTRNVKVAVADPSGDITELTDDLYENTGGSIVVHTIDPDGEESAHVEITDESHLTAGSTIYVLVKFKNNLKNESAPGNEFDAMCDNTETVEIRIGQETEELVAEAALRITTDSDGDDVLNNADNCPFVTNPGQEDEDGDGIGDVCDDFLNDGDNDGVEDDHPDLCLDTHPEDRPVDSDGCGPSEQ